MSAEKLAHGLNEHHQRHVRTTFQYIDNLLAEAEHTMADAGSPSPFSAHFDDTTPIQRKITHDYILRIRDAMRRFMEELGIPPAEPHSGAVWSASINFMFSSISLNELTPGKMRGYGPLSSEAAHTLDGIRAELDGLVGKLRNYLGTGAGGDLQKRLKRLGKTGDEVRLLTEIERIITAQGLVEFRAALTILLDRMETAAFEVGVFGRVSSGKSSLLNYILQTDMLPVGVTPVTAIPTRISHGPVAEAGIEFAEAQSRIIPLSELAEFATEEKNPANRKHVTQIIVKFPSDRLAEGVTFVDTPGLGSLAVAGAEETVAYLPRCDLGIVLIDASSGLTQDDLVVVQTLYQSGATTMVLISKTDLFSITDRQRMTDYVKENLQGQLRVEPPVHTVSVVGADAVLCDRWFENELRPLLARHQELVVKSHKRKIGVLREAVVAALERRLQIESGTGLSGRGGLANEAAEALREGDRILERAQGQAFFLTQKISKMRSEILKATAQEIAAALLESTDVDTASIFAAAIKGMLAEPVAAVLQAVEETRDALSHAIQLVASVSGDAISEELPKPAGMPVLDASELSKEIVIQKPMVLSLLGKSALVSHVYRKLEDEYGRALLEYLSFYANRLRRWMQQSIEAMRSAFSASADMHRAQFESAQSAGLPDASAIQNHLQILRDWDAVMQEPAA
jgi:small GTP-binding protein